MLPRYTRLSFAHVFLMAMPNYGSCGETLSFIIVLLNDMANVRCLFHTRVKKAKYLKRIIELSLKVLTIVLVML